MGRNGDWRQRVFCVLKMNEWMNEKELFIRNACLCSVWCHPLSNSIANTQVSSKPTRNKSHRKITLFLTALQALCSSFAFFLELILVQNNNNNCTSIQCFLWVRHCSKHTTELISLNLYWTQALSVLPFYRWKQCLRECKSFTRGYIASKQWRRNLIGGLCGFCFWTLTY